MQELEQINVGQQANDGTGDPLRDGMVKVNANFSKVQTGVDAVELAVSHAADLAAAAKEKADGDIPASEKGIADGVAPLDGAGKVPAAHLDDYLHSDERGAAGGVAPLDETGKVPAVNLPAAEDSIPLSQKGQPGGVATLDAEGLVPKEQLPPIPSGPAVGTPDYWPLRSSIPAGQIPQDGQTVSRATYPDLAAMVIAGTLPVVSEATWQSDPKQRGKYTLGDGSATIRLPDLNGKSAGSLGAVVWRGDGAMSAGEGGVIQRDALQNITGTFLGRPGGAAGQAGPLIGGSGAFNQTIQTGGNGVTGMPATGTLLPGDVMTFDASRVVRTATETRPLSVTGIWTVHAFGAVVNPGSVDAAQLASDLAALGAAFQSVDSEFQIVKASAFGVEQTIQNVTASRAVGVTYTNTTERPIGVYIGATAIGGLANVGIYMGAVPVARCYTESNGSLNGSPVSANALIPAGANYRYDAYNISGLVILEYQ
ncbi:phage tail protein [Achromobacter sp.]|uniref:phage tail protein n=1 Tax=Achromobacter sp. TaxID=134375 RepID=UPI002F92B6FC